MLNLKDMLTDLMEDFMPEGDRRSSRRRDEAAAVPVRIDDDRRGSRSRHRRSRDDQDRERFSFFED